MATTPYRKKVKELTVANERLYKETAWLTGMSPKQVEEIINSVSEYTANVIKSGRLETVRIPFFGTFQSKPKRVIRIANLKRDKDETI